MAHPNASSSTSSAIPKISSMQIMPKTISFKLIKPQPLASSSVVTPTTGSTHNFRSVPLDSLLNKSSSFKIQTQTVTHESSSITVPTTSSMQHMSAIKPQTLASSSVVTPTTGSTHNLRSVPLDSSIIDSDDDKENTSVFDKDGRFIWDYKTTMLFFTEYEQHEKKLQKRKYPSKETMFQAIAKSFQKRGYVNATKHHIKNKFKLLKKKWDKYIQRTMGKNSSGK
ncbi:PREDICTED: uncharacterized protein LOC108757764, partial [Trachymyrmex cornetzi]|uniref:uncharacterized protein LOC108757764 n=1 Tax=Trachymyrmex cornetzi TaxID=471704 RepID=UPI00084EF2EA